MNGEIDLSALALSPTDVMLRLLCAMLVGVVIGTEREYTHRPAGMRTHMLVALGACAVMITSQLIFYQYRPYGATPDPARLSAQVITGVGFLGAGTILREGTSIKGLTTAASIWAVACLGVAVGAGFFTVGLLGAVCMLITLIVFEWLQNKLMHGRDETYSFCVTCGNVAAAMEQINGLAAQADAAVSYLRVDVREAGVDVCFRVSFGGRHSTSRMQQFLAALGDCGEMTGIKSERCRT